MSNPPEPTIYRSAYYAGLPVSVIANLCEMPLSTTTKRFYHYLKMLGYSSGQNCQVKPIEVARFIRRMLDEKDLKAIGDFDEDPLDVEAELEDD